MAVIEVNENNDVKSNQSEVRVPGRDALNLNDLFTRCSSQGGWTGEANEYIQAIRTILEDPSMPVRATMQYISDDAASFNTPEGNSIVLVRENDIVNVHALLAEAKFHSAKDAFNVVFPKNKLINIVSCNRFMFRRPTQMAEYITQTLFAVKDEQVNDFSINDFTSNYQINIDTDMSNVRQFFDAHSPSPAICGDFGFIASLTDKTDNRYNAYQSSKSMFGVTGYVEFLRQESTGMFTPMVHITDILSMMASPKILAIALPLIAEIFINRHLWRHPFTAAGRTDINIGNLIVDTTSGKPYEVKGDQDFKKLFREYITQPVLCIDTRVGHTAIPGLNDITRALDHDLLIRKIFAFLEVAPASAGGLGKNIFSEIVGFAESAKTAKFSNLMDIRDFTYLTAVAKLKWSPKLDYLLTRIDADPVRRFEQIRDIFGEITPTHSCITTLLYGDFIKYIAAVVSSKIQVVMPIAADMPSIDTSEFVARSYQPGTSMFTGSGTGSYVGTGFMKF